MLSPEDARRPWQITVDAAPDLSSLRRNVQTDSELNPCLQGLRSICWKIFLVFGTTQRSKWPALLTDAREAYSSLRGHLLKFIDQPQELASHLDPLDDNKNSPWNTLRKDEELRAEIIQDVERCMPEEPFFRRVEIQQTLLDVLFIYCKLNPDVGYRQGMHELLAPILWVVQKDAIDTSSQTSHGHDEDLMFQLLSSRFVEHDTFTLFALVMQSAKSFYELGEPHKQLSPAQIFNQEPQGNAPIIARSKHVHEHYLAQVDPELAFHLTETEILPQIFLIRWIRLLFGRELSFDQLLCLWDSIFAEDPVLDLVDLICVSMLLRIRWQLLEADYTTALTLLLKYPMSAEQQSAQSFVADAIYLKNHLDRSGGSTIIEKYTGRSPQLVVSSSTTLNLARKEPFRRRSPMPSPATFIKQQGGVEAILQGAAKGIYARSEKLGVNQAVRDAVDQVQKNMQNFSVPSPRDAARGAADRWSLDEGEVIPTRRKTLIAIETRNKQLALMLEEALKDLRVLQVSDQKEAISNTDLLDIAVAKIQFVQVYLEDMSMPLPSEERTDAPAAPLLKVASVHRQHGLPTRSSLPIKPLASTASVAHSSCEMTQDKEENISHSTNTETSREVSKDDSIKRPSPVTHSDSHIPPSRPEAPIPTRSSIAQSSFSWMLESSPSDTSNSSSTYQNMPSKPITKPQSKKPIPGAYREKNAFLFGDHTALGDAGDAAGRLGTIVDSEEGVRLGTLRGKGKR